MPYHIDAKGPNDFEIIEDGSGKVIGKHPTRKQALGQLKALYANVPEARKEASDMDTTDKAASSDPGDYLIAEDREHPTTWHLQIKKDGTPDHTLMGAAWAALHDGYRGNKYEGPDKGAAIEKLKKLYAAEEMDTPATKELQAEFDKVNRELAELASQHDHTSKSIIDRVIAIFKGDTPGHEFHGNQYSQGSGSNFGERTSTSQAEHASKRADSASGVANARSNASAKKRAELHDEAAKLHREAAGKHVGAAMGKPYADQEYHHQVAAGHQSKADAHIQAARLFRESTQKEGRRNSSPDGDRLQQIHDLAVLNGANCPMVMKEASGALRWVLLSSNAFQDSDKEIISQKALEADVARTDKAQAPYGPLRWWHMGAPDPVGLHAGSGADIGDCDYRAMSGRVLIESGTFRSEQIGAAVKERADSLAGSIGFFHPRDEPDSEGVYQNIVQFERSLLPRGKASNTLTALTVKGDSDMATSAEKEKALADLLGDPTMAKAVIQQAEATEKAADERGLKFKEQEPPKDKPAEPPADAATKEPTGDVTAVPAHGESGLMKAFGLSPEDDESTCKEKIGKVLNAMMDAKMSAGAKETAEKEAGLKAQLESLTNDVKELKGDVPRGLQGGFRASLAEATLLKDVNLKSAPAADPLDDVISQLMGVKKS